MSTTDWLMTVKVLLLVAAGGGFAWWQLRDLANEKRLSKQREVQNGVDKGNADS